MVFLLLAFNLRVHVIPFGHRSQVCARKFTVPNLRCLATPFSQGLTSRKAGIRNCVNKWFSARTFVLMLTSLVFSLVYR